MSGLFDKGEYIVYGTTGVCLVKDITTMSMDEQRKDRLYYVLEPMGVSGSRIMTPVENNKSIMRPVLSREEAFHLIDRIQEVAELGISDDKQRESPGTRKLWVPVTAVSGSASSKPCISAKKTGCPGERG